MHDVTPVQIAALQAVDQHLGGGDVGGDRHAVHITQPQQVLLAAAARPSGRVLSLFL